MQVKAALQGEQGQPLGQVVGLFHVLHLGAAAGHAHGAQGLGVKFCNCFVITLYLSGSQPAHIEDGAVRRQAFFRLFHGVDRHSRFPAQQGGIFGGKAGVGGVNNGDWFHSGRSFPYIIYNIRKTRKKKIVSDSRKMCHFFRW